MERRHREDPAEVALEVGVARVLKVIKGKWEFDAATRFSQTSRGAVLRESKWSSVAASDRDPGKESFRACSGSAPCVRVYSSRYSI